MTDSITVDAICETNGKGVLLYAGNFPGAYVRGETKRIAAKKFPAELRAYCRWANLPVPGEVEVRFVQEKSSELQVEDADSDVLFDTEREPLSAAEYEACKALCLRSARDFLTLYTSVPDKTAALRSPRATFYGDLPHTAEEMYIHTKNVNSYYFGEIGVETGNEPDILACREAGFAQLERQPDFLQNRVFCGSYNELWSLRKLLRRFLWHDRIHARAMYRTACALFSSDAVADPFCFSTSESQKSCRS